MDFCVKFVFPIFVPLHFCWKNQCEITIFEFLEFQKMQNVIFSMVFCKKWKFWQVHLSMARKKIFRDGSDGPKIVFNNILWHAAIKICGRLIRFLHFWWFHVFVFWISKKSQKMQFFQFFSSNFLKFAYFLLFFTFFVSKILFFYRNFFDF